MCSGLRKKKPFYYKVVLAIVVVTDLRHLELARLWSGLDVLGPSQYVYLPAVRTVLAIVDVNAWHENQLIGLFSEKQQLLLFNST